MNNFYTYIYLDPRKPGLYEYGDYTFDYEPFYVGKGKGERWLTHKYNSKDIRNTDYRYRKIRNILKENLKPIILKVKENLSDREASNLEIWLIWLIGRYELGLGSLTNHTAGGEGSSGWHHNEETKDKISKALRGENNPMYGKKHSSKTKEKMSKSAKGNKYNLGRIISPESREKMSEAAKGKTRSEAARENISKSKRGKNNPMYGKSAWNKGKHHSSETIAKMRKPKSPKARENISKAMKGKPSWNKGMSGIKYKLKNDFIILTPKTEVITNG